jgi:hypothetical protein
MASRRVRGFEQGQIVSVLNIVLDSATDESDISDDENSFENSRLVEYQESDSGSSTSESESDDDELEEHVRSERRRENLQWTWTNNENTHIIHPFRAQSGVFSIW